MRCLNKTYVFQFLPHLQLVYLRKKNICNLPAERLLNLSQQQIVEQASDIIFGQLRSVVSSLTSKKLMLDRDKFLAKIKESVTPELQKIGLTLINVNIRDITDASLYIESIGKKAEGRSCC